MVVMYPIPPIRVHDMVVMYPIPPIRVHDMVVMTRFFHCCSLTDSIISVSRLIVVPAFLFKNKFTNSVFI